MKLNFLKTIYKSDIKSYSNPLKFRYKRNDTDMFTHLHCITMNTVNYIPEHAMLKIIQDSHTNKNNQYEFYI